MLGPNRSRSVRVGLYLLPPAVGNFAGPQALGDHMAQAAVRQARKNRKT